MDKRTTVNDGQSSISTSDASFSQELQTKPSNKICTAIDVVKQAMQQLDACLHQGYIYKKGTNGKLIAHNSSYIPLEFQHSLICNTQLFNILTTVASVLSLILSKIIRQIKIDYGLVEVKPCGVCISF